MMKKILLFSIVGVIINIFPLIPSGNFFNNWLSIILILNFSTIFILEKSI